MWRRPLHIWVDWTTARSRRVFVARQEKGCDREMNRHSTGTTVLASLAMAAVAACTAGGRGEWAGTVTDSAGIEIVSNTEQGIWTEETRWTVNEELRIGSLEGDPDYQFGQIGLITVGSDGRMYVIDAQAQQLKVFTAAGEFERTIGGPGGGPGELGAGAAVVVIGPGDTLLVPDIANRRVNRYTPDGTSHGSFPLELEKGMPINWRETVGGVAEQIRPLGLPGMPAGDGNDAILLVASDGTVLDTLMKFPSGGTLNLGGQAPEIKLFSPEPSWTISEDHRIAYGVSDEYRIGVYTPGGALERIITMPFEQEAVSERDRRAVMSFLEDAWLQAGVPPQALTQLRGIVQFGEFFPAFAQIRSGPEGTLWVQHYRSVGDMSEEELENYNVIEESGAPDWDVFNSEGQLLGRVTMPDRFAPRVFKDENIYGVWRDELDVQYVMRLRIVGL